MQPSDITAEFVQGRAVALAQRWGERNRRMDEYEELYRLNLWDEAPEEDELRVTVPTAFDTVEMNRTLLLTQAPVIAVQPSQVTGVAADQAALIEKYLYGAWDRAHVMDALDGAEWYASCLGEGVIRVVYDDQAVEDEFPILVQAVDPRNVYATPGGRPFVDLELVHQFTRTRREIVDELGKRAGGVWLRELGGGPPEGEQREDWLDDEVEYIEYWRVDVKTEEEVEAPRQEEPLGPLGRMLRAAGQLFGWGDVVEPQGDSETAEGQEQKRKRRRRVLTHAVVADGQLVKTPTVMPGYHRIPFIRYPGIKTPLRNEGGSLSVLFPITGGSGENGAMGVAAAEAQAVAMRQRLIEMYSNGALITDDASMTIDWTAGAINRISKGKTWSFLVPPGPLPAADAQVQMMRQYIEDSTFPAAMRGRYLGDMSGLALSTLTNPVLMKVAQRQMIRERAYRLLNRTILELTEEWSGEGWEVWGSDRNGQAFELEITPDVIGGYYRNEVKLSASLPKDQAGETLADAQLVQQKLMSRETFLDGLQQRRGLAGQSPMDEMKRILMETLLFEGPTAQRLAEVVLSEYSAELAAVMQSGQQQAAQQPMGPGAPPPGAGAGPAGPGGPMMGVPPGVVPPQAMPQALAQMGPEGLAAMMAMQGRPGPGAPVGPEAGAPGEV